MTETATATKWKGGVAFEKEWSELGDKGEGDVTYGTVRYKAIQGGWKPTRVAGSTDTASNDEGGALGDIRAGRLFARAMKDKLRFVAPRNCWLKWSGTVWEWCNKGEEMQAAKKVADKILDHVAAQFKADPERHRKALAWAMALQGIKRLEAMIELAKSEEVPA